VPLLAPCDDSRPSRAHTDPPARKRDGASKKQGNILWLSKQTGTRTREAVLELWTHRFGWELQLLVDGEFLRSHVCRTQDEVLDTIEGGCQHPRGRR
jgi:hypothetical protein